MNVQSRLLGYFSGNPGDFMTPLLEVKFLEHSGPAGRTTGRNEMGKRGGGAKEGVEVFI